MALKMRNTSGGSLDVPEKGTHIARVVGVLDLDLQPGYEYQGEMVEPQYKVSFTYELGASRTKEDKPHWVSEDFKVSDHERSKMYARVNAIDPNGKITNNGENLAKLIGAPCMVSTDVNDKGYAKIIGVSSIPNGYPVSELENDPQLFDWDNPDMEVYKRLPEFVQKKLTASLNFDGSPLHRALAMTHGANNGEENSY